MKSKKILLSVAVFLILVSLSGQDQGGKYNLRYDMAKGKSFLLKNKSYIIDNMVNTDSSYLFLSVKTNMLIEFNVIDNYGPKGLRLEAKYNKKTRNINFYSGRVNDDTLGVNKGLKICFSISPKGKISDFGNYAQLENYLKKDEAFTLNNLQEEIIHLFPHLPDHPIEIGESWIGGVEGEGSQESFQLKYTLLGEEKVNGMDCLKIIASYTTSSEFSIEREGESLNVATSSKGNDIYLFAFKKGFLLSRKSIGDEDIKILNDKNELFQNRERAVFYETDI